MSDEFKYYIPRYLDYPRRFGPFTWDELVITFTPVFIALWLGQFIYGVAIGGGLYFAVYYIKNSGQANIVFNLQYWFFPKQFNSIKHTAPSHIREYVG